LDNHGLKRKIVGCVKDEGLILKNMIITLKLVVSCDVLGLEEKFQGTCFGHAFLKLCQYATTYEIFAKV